MAWYYYTGKTVCSIPVKKGLSIAVRPHSKIEILDETVEVRALKRRGELRLIAPPKGAVSVQDIPVPVQDIAKIVPKSDFARSFAEKGVTLSPGISPRKRVGKPEMTEGEIAVAEAASVPAEVQTPEAVNDDGGDTSNVDQAEELPEDKEKQGKKKRR